MSRFQRYLDKIKLDLGIWPGPVSGRSEVVLLHAIFPQTAYHIHVRNHGQKDLHRFLSLMQKKKTFVPLDSFQKEDSNTLALTFDDGLLNTLSHALPVLEELNIPATVFISTGRLYGIHSLWPDQLSRISLWSSEFQWKGQWYHKVGASTFRNSKGESLTDALKMAPAEEVYEALEKKAHSMNLTSFSPSEREYFELLKGEEIKLLSNHPLIQLGSHGITHQSMISLANDDLNEELTSSKKYLEQVIGKPVHAFSFPFGEYGEREVLAAEKAGYTAIYGVDTSGRSSIPVHSRFGIYNHRSIESYIKELL